MLEHDAGGTFESYLTSSCPESPRANPYSTEREQVQHEFPELDAAVDKLSEIIRHAEAESDQPDQACPKRSSSGLGATNSYLLGHLSEYI